MTTLQDLKKIGAFAHAKPVQKTIRFDVDGEKMEAIVHVRQLGIGDYEAIQRDEKDNDSFTARAISESILLGEGGKERISLKEAFRLKPSIANAMLEAFSEVNAPKKSLAGTSNSSANSVSPSEE